MTAEGGRMKAKDLRRLQREAEKERKLYELPTLDAKKLLANEKARQVILETARQQAGRRKGGDSD